MTLQQVNLGTPPAGSDGDDPRTAFTRINSNFKALDDMGLTGPVVATREVDNLNDAAGPGKWIGTAAATNRPAGFTRSSIEVVEEVSGDLMQQATDKATGQIANRVYTASTDAWSAWVIIGSGGGPGPEILPIASGGTGAGTAAGARTNLGLKALATEDVAPVTGGGTGATNAAQARANLGVPNAANAFTGATSSTAGAPGLVPAPAAGDQNKFLTGGGVYVAPPGIAWGQISGTLANQVDLQAVLNQIKASNQFSYLYPNGGTSGAPANASINSRYVVANPFPGETVIVVPQLFFGGKWADTWFSSYGSGAAYGVTAGQYGDDIVVQTAVSGLDGTSNLIGSLTAASTGATSAPIRLKVFRNKVVP